MELLRSWRREALRATGVGLLAPGAIFLALVLAAAGGGLGGVGSLGQLVSGPGVPAGEVAVASGPDGSAFAPGSTVLPSLPATGRRGRGGPGGGGSAGAVTRARTSGSGVPMRGGAGPGPAGTPAPGSRAGTGGGGTASGPLAPRPLPGAQAPGSAHPPVTSTPPPSGSSSDGPVQGAVDAVRGLLKPRG